MTVEVLILLSLGMGNGLLHALDADHILAVSAVAMGDESAKRRVLRTAALWALGHGATLLLFAVVVIGLGWVIPEAVSRSAEMLVGVILIAVGGAIVHNLWKGNIRITRHNHDGLPPHTHIHRHTHGWRSDHRPVLVGIVHGIAGSAPLLALLPLVIRQQFAVAGFYILLFSLSVGLMMCLFGGALGSLIRFIDARSPSGMKMLQVLLGLQAIGFGGYWVYAAL